MLVMDDDGTLFIGSGLHSTHSVGYIVCETAQCLLVDNRLLDHCIYYCKLPEYFKLYDISQNKIIGVLLP
jgi:hypothetical protein